MDLLENCTTAYSFRLSELQADIMIKAALTVGTLYIVKVTDKFGNRFSSAPIVAGGDGSLSLTIPASFPTCWFNRNAGKFCFELSKTAEPWAPEVLTFGSSTYTQIIVEFDNDNGAINTIQ